jgi:O-antigen ligase
MSRAVETLALPRQSKGRRASRHDSRALRLTERILIAGLLALLVWLPLPLASNRDWSAALFVLVTALLAAAWAALLLIDPHRRRLQALRAGWPLLALLGLAQLWVAAQWLTGLSTDSGATFQYLLLGCAYSLLFALVLGLFTSPRRLTLLLAVLLVSGVAQAFYGSLMTLSGIERLAFQAKEAYLGVVTGTFVNRNHMAGYMELTLAAGIGLLLALRDGRPLSVRSLPDLLLGPKAWIRLGLVIMVIALVMTHSRMGNAAFFSSLIIVGGLFTLISREHRVRNAAILASLLLIDLLIISNHFGLDGLQQRLMRTQFADQVIAGEVVRPATEQRDDVVVYAIPQFMERPWTGFGAGAFEASFQRFPGADIRPHYDHAHNDYLQFLIEFGAIGSAPLVLFVLGALFAALRAMRRPDSLYRSGIGLGAGLGILALVIHAATDFNHQIPANAATFVVLCAIAVVASGIQEGGRREAAGNRKRVEARG